MNDIERLLNATFPFVEDLLKKYGEFFPLASAIQTNDSIATVGTYDGEDKPKSDEVIESLKDGLKKGAQNGEYKVIAIFYDVKVIDPNTNQKTDAIAVLVEDKNETTSHTLFYPYKLIADNEILFSIGWKNSKENEIFIH